MEKLQIHTLSLIIGPEKNAEADASEEGEILGVRWHERGSMSNAYDEGAVSRAISQLIGVILYGLQTIGHTWVFPLR